MAPRRCGAAAIGGRIGVASAATPIGNGLRLRKDERRTTDVGIAVHVLNRMLVFGRPIYVGI
jgi:hypothetical protein